ncbi:MAG: DUF4416 family protein [Desulfatibacillum sp.]|nr:DUF4416 family protein [Desulfatibacillum sp.]
MSTPSPPSPAKLVIGIFTADKSLAEPVVGDLTARFGPVDMMSPWYSFHHTDYYEPEMGGPLFRRLFAFTELIPQDSLPEIKLAANAIEATYAKESRRAVNIDPGFLVMERFILATGKNFTHRVYLARGIYADLTLLYTKGKFTTLPWTYPDYAEPEIHHFLLAVRKKLAACLKDPALCMPAQT